MISEVQNQSAMHRLRWRGSKPQERRRRSTPDLNLGTIYEPNWDWISKEVRSHRDTFITAYLLAPNQLTLASLYTPSNPFDLSRFYGFCRFLAWRDRALGVKNSE